MESCDNMLMYTLASARVNSDLTQKQVAEILKVSEATVNAWENGKTEPKISQARELSELYKIPLDRIKF